MISDMKGKWSASGWIRIFENNIGSVVIRGRQDEYIVVAGNILRLVNITYCYKYESIYFQYSLVIPNYVYGNEMKHSTSEADSGRQPISASEH